MRQRHELDRQRLKSKKNDSEDRQKQNEQGMKLKNNATGS
jgi:hypothetical protein